MVENDNILVTDHAWNAMQERFITTNEIIQAIKCGEIIESYLEDKPCPNFLIFGLVDWGYLDKKYTFHYSRSDATL